MVSRLTTPVKIFIFILLTSFLNVAQETIEEKVDVVNIEVPVRVVYKGKLVGGLKKSDFTIYENGKLQHIHGFNEYRRKINIKETGFDVRLEKVITKPRLFVLVFNLTDYFLKMDKGIDYLFEKVFRKHDRIMVLANYTFIPEKTITDLQTDKNQLKSIIKKECKTARVQILKVFRDMQNQLQLLKNELNHGFIFRTSLEAMASFLDKYLMYFRIYKKSYLIPDLDKYYHFARYLENVKIEKWVINFYQLERFPQLRPEGPFWKRIEQQLGWNAEGKRRLKDLLRRIDIELKVSTDFPVDQITKLFLKVNTTFHSIFMKPVNIDSSEDYEYREINTDIENSLRGITKITGGELILSNNLEKSLEKITEKEDIFYMLTYEPPDRQKKNKKIKVKLKEKPYKVIYDKTVYADFFKEYLDRKEKDITNIRIENLHYDKCVFSFNVTDFKIQNIGEVNQGKVKVQIKIIDLNNTVVFNKSTVLPLKNDDNKLSIRLDELKPGDYNIVVEVNDLLTGKSYLEYIKTEIADTETKIKRVDTKQERIIKIENQLEEGQEFESRELEKYLKGAAEYCKKLTEKAFHFICKEKVTISYKTIDPDKRIRSPYVKLYRQSTKRYLFDYQILYQKNQINEHRKLLSKVSNDEQMLSVKNLVYSFLSERPVFGPRTLLSKERQHMFRYKIVKTINNKNQKFVIIDVIPKKSEEVFFSSGKVWIDSFDFSVRKIQVTPRYIQGYENLLRIANAYQARLNMDCQIEYDREYKGLYFPTEVIIIERYKGGMSIVREFGSKGWERTRTLFTYQDYKFFNVNVDVLEN